MSNFWAESNRVRVQIDPQVEFLKVEKMLCGLAWKVAQTCPVTFEESRSEAYFAFISACRTYDGRRGSKFSSWCYFKVWTSLKSWITKRTRDPLVCTEINDELTGLAPDERSDIMDLIEDLSEDAQEIIQLLVETPAEVLDLGRSRRGKILDFGDKMTPKQLLVKVKEYLSDKGRDKRRIEKAQQEIELRFWEVWAKDYHKRSNGKVYSSWFSTKASLELINRVDNRKAFLASFNKS